MQRVMARADKKNRAHRASDGHQYRRRAFAWALYDWANHGYITVTATSFFPPYFIAIAAPAFLASQNAAGGPPAALARDTASNIFALAVSFSLLFASLLAPVVGAYADIAGLRKRLLIIMSLAGGALSSLMFVLTTGRWELALVLYFLTQVAMNLALGLNSSLLPHIARHKDLDRISSLGYALGYIGGGVLLMFCTTLYLFAGAAGIERELAVRISFMSVGIWWIVFSIPLIIRVPEPPAAPLSPGRKGSPLRDSFVRLGRTLAEIRRYRELFKMLVAFWLYMEGIGAIILLAAAYGAALGLDTAVLIGTLLMTQFVAFPYSIAYGYMPDSSKPHRGAVVSMILWTGVTFPCMGAYANLHGGLGVPAVFGLMAANQAAGVLFSVFIGERLFAGLTRRINAKRAVILGLLIYCIVPIWGYYLHTRAEFFMIGWLVGSLQGGTQALSRSMYASLTPASKSGEFFGLYGLSEKFAGVLGPLLYGIVGQITHNPRDSILSITLFFILGIVMLGMVDVEKGSAIAAREDEVPGLPNAPRGRTGRYLH